MKKLRKLDKKQLKKEQKAQNQAALREELTIQIQEKYNGFWVRT